LYPNLFYVSYFNFLRICFIKFIVHKMNYEMIKSIMILLTGREKSDMTDAGITVSYRLIQTTGEGLIVERERVKYRQTTAGTRLLSPLAYSRPPLIIVCCHVTLKLPLCFLGFF
jgi:hypothetical protein